MMRVSLSWHCGIARAPLQCPTAGGFAMHKKIPVRWIEYAEAKSVQEHAGLQRDPSEPPVNTVYATNGLSWFDWPRGLARALGRTVAAVRSLSVDKRVWARGRTRAAFKRSPTK